MDAWISSNQQAASSSIHTRIPTEIVAVLRELAQTHERSLNGELVRALREYVERHQNHQNHQNEK